MALALNFKPSLVTCSGTGLFDDALLQRNITLIFLIGDQNATVP